MLTTLIISCRWSIYMVMVYFYHESMSKRGWKESKRPCVTALLDGATWQLDFSDWLIYCMWWTRPGGITHGEPLYSLMALSPTLLAKAPVGFSSNRMTKLPKYRVLSLWFWFALYLCRAKICSAVTRSLSSGPNLLCFHLRTASAAHMSMSDSLMVQPLKNTTFVSEKLDFFSMACNQINNNELHDLVRWVQGSPTTLSLIPTTACRLHSGLTW